MNARRFRSRMQPKVDALESRCLLTATFAQGVWTIRGDSPGATIRVDRALRRPDVLRAFENGRLVATHRASQVEQIRLIGVGRGNTLQIDQSHGLIRTAALLDGGKGAKNRLIGGSGETVFRHGTTGDSLHPYGSARDFRRFLEARARSIGGRFSPRPGGPEGLTKTTGTTYSYTNVQVPGVDEADIVKTDGSSLYVITGFNLVIVNAQDPAHLSVVSTTAIDGSPIAEYLDGGRLTVLSRLWQPSSGSLSDGKQGANLPMLRLRGQGRTEVTVYDVSDPSRAPSIVQQSTIDGDYTDSRMIDGKLYLITQTDLLSGCWEPPILYARGAKARASGGSVRLDGAAMDRLLPTYSSTVNNPDGSSTTASGLLVQPGDILAPTDGDGTNLLAISVIDVQNSRPGPIGATAMMGSYASTIHVNADSLYVFSPNWWEDSTSIAQFSLTGANPSLVATGAVPGTLYNPYSADASGGYLRVATSAFVGNRTDNGVYVLQAQAGRLNIVGLVDGIAPGESIQSARFLGDRAFLVTYQQTDPLWGIDLGNPTSPKVAGSLVVAGYSTFLQPINGDTILGIGRDVNPATQVDRGLNLSLFNVANLSQPARIADQSINAPGTDFVWSNAEWDSHALGYYPELGVVAIPFQAVGTTNDAVPNNPDDAGSGWWTELSLKIFKVDATLGLQFLGTVQHDSPVERSVRIGDTLFSIADNDVKAVQVSANALIPLGSVTIASSSG